MKRNTQSAKKIFKEADLIKIDKKKSAYIAEKILEAIEGDKIVPGDKLPSEREVADTLNVSRPPVREALSALSLAGYTKSVSGEGTYVVETHKVESEKSEALSILKENESPFEALRVRKSYEPCNAEIAASQATSEDIKTLKRTFKHMQNAVEGHNLPDIEAYFRVNRKFHLDVAQATHNSIIVNIIASLMDITDQKLWRETVNKYFAEPSHVRHYVEKHKNILTAIEEGDGQLAKEEMQSHFEDTAEEVQKYL